MALLTPPPSLARARPQIRVARKTPSPPPRVRALLPSPERDPRTEHDALWAYDDGDLIFHMSPVRDTFQTSFEVENTPNPLLKYSDNLMSRKVVSPTAKSKKGKPPQFALRRRLLPLDASPLIEATPTDIPIRRNPTAGKPASFNPEENIHASDVVIMGSSPSVSDRQGHSILPLHLQTDFEQAFPPANKARSDPLATHAAGDEWEKVVGWDGPDTLPLEAPIESKLMGR
ncbi:hypothetical protein SISNIDRAFT_498656 [Sistotremastrum niveocremeum HHB9708]|uniref:Uncharacterized protein n=1 Tax=Sistotremastrum niveocremeum HHB9708 TaxID=1314777 RepID=A0A164MR50_9AGAM|nr:hypothetical protein SISNIDRAFT_498656 [Sistotremastrum niveocremeum HHB9708]